MTERGFNAACPMSFGGNESGLFWVRRVALGEATRLPFLWPEARTLMQEDEEAGGRTSQSAGDAENRAHLAEIAKALVEIVSELKEVNTSLRAIARSQAQRATQRRPAAEP